MLPVILIDFGLWPLPHIAVKRCSRQIEDPVTSINCSTRVLDPGGNYFLTFYLGGHTISNVSSGSCLDLLRPFGVPLAQGVFNEHRQIELAPQFQIIVVHG